MYHTKLYNFETHNNMEQLYIYKKKDGIQGTGEIQISDV